MVAVRGIERGMSMDKWEYQFISSRYLVDRTNPNEPATVLYKILSRNAEQHVSSVQYLHDVANDLGNDGWEIVSDVIITDGKSRETVFKRPKQPVSTTTVEHSRRVY